MRDGNEKDDNMAKFSMNGFVDLLEAVNSIKGEATLRLNTDSFTVREMDAGSVILISFAVPLSTLPLYAIDKNVNITLNTYSLCKVLKNVKDDLLTISTEGDSKVSISKPHYLYKTLILDTPKTLINKDVSIEYNYSIEIGCELLKDIIKKAGVISSYLTFVADKSSIAFFAQGDGGELNQNFDYAGNSNVLRSIKANENVSVSLSMELLVKTLIKAEKKDKVRLYLKSNEPVKVSYEVGNITVNYSIAPFNE